MMNEAQREYANIKNQVPVPPAAQTPFSRVSDARDSVDHLTSRIGKLMDQLIGPDTRTEVASVSGSTPPNPVGLLHDIARYAADIEAMTQRAHREIDRLSKIIG